MINTKVTESVEKMRVKERFINSQHDGLREEYQQVSARTPECCTQATTAAGKKKHPSKAKLENDDGEGRPAIKRRSIENVFLIRAKLESSASSSADMFYP